MKHNALTKAKLYLVGSTVAVLCIAIIWLLLIWGGDSDAVTPIGLPMEMISGSESGTVPHANEIDNPSAKVREVLPESKHVEKMHLQVLRQLPNDRIEPAGNSEIITYAWSDRLDGQLSAASNAIEWGDAMEMHVRDVAWPRRWLPAESNASTPGGNWNEYICGVPRDTIIAYVGFTDDKGQIELEVDRSAPYLITARQFGWADASILVDAETPKSLVLWLRPSHRLHGSVRLGSAAVCGGTIAFHGLEREGFWFATIDGAGQWSVDVGASRVVPQIVEPFGIAIVAPVAPIDLSVPPVDMGADQGVDLQCLALPRISVRDESGRPICRYDLTMRGVDGRQTALYHIASRDGAAALVSAYDIYKKAGRWQYFSVAAPGYEEKSTQLLRLGDFENVSVVLGNDRDGVRLRVITDLSEAGHSARLDVGLARIEAGGAGVGSETHYSVDREGMLVARARYRCSLYCRGFALSKDVDVGSDTILTFNKSECGSLRVTANDSFGIAGLARISIMSASGSVRAVTCNQMDSVQTEAYMLAGQYLLRFYSKDNYQFCEPKLIAISGESVTDVSLPAAAWNIERRPRLVVNGGDAVGAWACRKAPNEEWLPLGGDGRLAFSRRPGGAVQVRSPKGIMTTGCAGWSRALADLVVFIDDAGDEQSSLLHFYTPRKSSALCGAVICRVDSENSGLMDQLIVDTNGGVAIPTRWLEPSNLFYVRHVDVGAIALRFTSARSATNSDWNVVLPASIETKTKTLPAHGSVDIRRELWHLALDIEVFAVEECPWGQILREVGVNTCHTDWSKDFGFVIEMPCSGRVLWRLHVVEGGEEREWLGRGTLDGSGNVNLRPPW